MTNDRVSNSTILSEHRGIVNARYILSIINFIAVLVGTILTNHFVSIRGASRGVVVHIGIIIAINVVQILLCIGDYVIKQFMGIYFKYLPIISYGVGGLWLLLTIGELFAGSRELGELRLDLAIVAGIQIVIAFIAYVVWPALDHSAIQKLTTKKVREQSETEPTVRAKKARGFIIRYVLICLFVAITQVAMLFAYKVPPRVYDLFSDSRALQYELNDSKDGYIVTGVYLGTSPYANVPATYNGLPVIGVSANAFSNLGMVDKYKINKITFGTEELDENGNKTVVSNVKFIESNAIRNDKIETITLPESIVNIEDGAISSNSLTTLIYESKADFSISYFECSSLSTITMLGKNVGNISSLQGMDKNVTIEVDKDIYNQYRKNNFEYVTSFKPILSEDEFCVDFYTGCDYYIESIFSKYGQDVILSYKDLKNDKMTGISPVVDTLSYIRNENELGTNGAKKDSAFRGWYTDSSFGQEIDFTLNGTVSFSGNTSIYGKWIDEYTGILDWGTHQPSSSEDKIYWTDEDVVDLPVIKNRLGYTDGVKWNVKGSSAQVQNTRSISGNQTFEATWILDKPTGVDIIANATGDWWQASQDGSLVMFSYDELRELTLGAVYGHPLEDDSRFEDNAKPFTLKWEKISDSSFRDNGTDLISVKNVADSGQYKLTVIFRSPYGEVSETSTTISVSIAKKALDIGTKRFDEAFKIIEYTGANNKLPLTGEYAHSNIQAQFTYYDKYGNELGSAGVKDVGEYKVKVLFSKNNAAEASNYETAELQTEYEITPIYLAFDSWTSTALTYNAQPQSVTMRVRKVLAGDTVNLIYKNGANVQTNAGTYVAEVIGVDNPNYSINKIAEQCRVEWQIAPKTLTVKEWRLDGVASNSKVVYDAQIHKADAYLDGVFSGDIVKVVYDETGTYERIATNAGSYTAKVKGVDNANYTLSSTNSSFDWKVEKRALTVSFNNPTLIYNGASQGVVATIGNIPDRDISKFTKSAFALGNNNASISATVDQTSVSNGVKISFSAVNADSYEVDILGLASTSVSSNYTITSTSKEFAINKKELSITSWQKKDLKTNNLETVTSNAEYVYNKDGYTLSPVLSGVVSREAVTLNVIDGKKDGVGTYTTTASLPTTYKNYTLKNENLSVSWKITPKAVNFSWKFNGTTQTGTPTLTYNASVVNVTPSYDGVYSEDAITLTYGESDMSKTNVGTYKVSVTDVGNSNYMIGTGSEITWTIAPKKVDISWKFNDTPKTGTPSFVYDARTIIVSPAFSGVCDGDALSVVYGESDLVKTDAGEYTVSITSLGNSNYQIASGASVNWSITPKQVTVTWYNLSKIYNGKYQGPSFSLDGMCEYANYRVSTVADGSTEYFDLTSLSATAQYSFASKDVAIDADTYNFSVKQILKYDSATSTYVVDSNYEIIDNGGGKNFEIAPKTLALTGIWKYSNSKLASAQYVNPFIYNKSEFTLTTDIDETSLVTHNGAVADVYLVYTGNKGTSASSYTAKVSYLAGEQADNYTLPTQGASISWKITPKPITFTWNKGEFVYNGAINTVIASVATGAVSDTDGLVYTGDSVTISNYATANKQTNVGSYNTSVKTISNSNYCIDESSNSYKHSWEITPKPVTLNWSATTYTYNGSIQYPTASYTNSYNGETVHAEYKVVPTSTNVGSYTIIAIGVDDSNYVLASGQETKTYTITPRKISLTWGTSSYTYNGQPRTLTASVSNAVSGDEVNVIISGQNVATNVGTYACEATGVDNANYTIDGVTNTEKSLVITPKALGLTWTGSNATYDGKAHSLTATLVGVVTGDEVELNYSTTENSFINAGDYTVIVSSTLTGADSGNYTVLQTPKSITISKKTIYVAWTGATSVVYDGQAHSLTASLSGVVGNDDVRFSYSSTGGTSFTEVGRHNVSVSSALTGDSASNYSLSSSRRSETLVISACIVTPTWIIPSNLVYDGTLKSFECKLDKTLIDDTIVYTIKKDGTVVDEVRNAGMYTIIATFSDGSNYNFENGTNSTSCSFKIEKSKVNLTWTNPANLVYNGLAKEYSCVSDNSLAELTYTIKKGSTTVTEIKGAGSYEITAALADTKNFEIVNGNKTMFVIAKCKVTPTWNLPVGTTYDGTAKAWSYTINTDAETAGLSVTHTMTRGGSTVSEIKHAGSYTITLSLSDTANFEFASGAKSSNTVSVAQKEITLTWPSTTTIVYDGVGHMLKPQISGGVTGDSIVLTYEGSANEIRTAVGTTTYTISGIQNTNYKFKSGTVLTKDLVITPAPVSIYWPSTTTFVYDGQAHSIAPTVTGIKSTNVNFTYVDGNSLTDVGTKVVTIVLNNANYTLEGATGSASARLEITPATATITWPQSTFTYDATEHKLIPTVTGVDGATVSFSYVNGNSLTNAGEKTVTVVLNDGNYVFADGKTSASQTLTVSPAKVTITWPTTKSFTYTGNEISLAPTVVGVGGATAGVNYVNGNSLVNVGTKQVTISSLKDSNYTLDGATGALYCDLTITPQAVRITWSGDESVVYDGKTHSLVATVTGASTGASVAIEYVSNSFIDVGTYTCKVALANSNYVIENPSDAEKTLEITPMEIQPVWSIPSNLEADGNAKEVSVSANKTLSGAEITFVIEKDGVVVDEIKDEGVYTVTAKIEGTKAGNYKFATSSETTKTIIIYAPANELPEENDIVDNNFNFN